MAHLGAMLAHFEAHVGPSWGYVGPSWSYIGPAWGLFWLILGLCWPILGQHARGGGPSLLRRGENRLRQCHGQGAPGRTTGSEAVATAVKLEVKTEPHPCALLGALMSSESRVMDKQDTLVYARALRVLAAQHTSLWSSQQAADTSVLWLCASQPQPKTPLQIKTSSDVLNSIGSGLSSTSISNVFQANICHFSGRIGNGTSILQVPVDCR